MTAIIGCRIHELKGGQLHHIIHNCKVNMVNNTLRDVNSQIYTYKRTQDTADYAHKG